MITLIKALSILGLRPTGVEHLPEALERAGLRPALGITDSQTITPPPYDPRRDPVTHLLNPQALATYSTRLADAVQVALDHGRLPLILGGDCSIILGPMLALRRRGRYGLFFLDGHADFYQPEASDTGEAADMDLALVSGRGPDILVNLEGRRPLVRDTDIVQFGQRDQAETRKYGSQQIAATPIHVYDLHTIKQRGAQPTATEALNYLLSRPLAGFWAHLDADVIADAEMPAVDYRLPGGLSFAEVHDVLQLLVASGRVAGLSLSIYNPALDPGEHLAPKLVHLLTTLTTAPGKRPDPK